MPKPKIARIKYNIEFFKLAVQSSFEPLVMGYFMQALAILCGQLKIDISIPKSGRVEREIKNLLMLFQFLPYQPERYIYVDIDLETQTVRLKKENYIEQQRRAITFPQSTYYKSFYDYVRKNGSFEMISIESADDSLIKDLVIEQNAQHPITFKNLVKFLEGLIDFYEEEWIYYLTMLSPNLLLRIFRNSKIREIVEEDLALQEQVYFTFFGVYDLNQIYALLKESETKLAIGDSQCLDKIKNLFKDRGADFLRYLIHRKKFIFELECLIRFRKEIENAYSKEQ